MFNDMHSNFNVICLTPTNLLEEKKSINVAFKAKTDFIHFNTKFCDRKVTDEQRLCLIK